MELPGRGVGVPDSTRGKRIPGFTEKNFVRLLIFFRLLFFCCPSLPVPIETPNKRFRRGWRKVKC